MNRESLIAGLIRLQAVPKIGVASIVKLLHRYDLTYLLSADNAFLRQQLNWNDTQINVWQNPDQSLIDSVLRWLDRSEHGVMTILDADYPYLLKQIHSPPLFLFLQGNVELLHSSQIAMVGSRDCSDYGKYWSQYFATQLAYAGLTITSGMALGIDSYCHQACLACGGKTVAVLGSGLNHLYPKRNKPLANQIIEQGLLISEFFPNTLPIAENFPRRNRIISGLSLGTLIVEADIKSGSLITARYALEQNREVFALPGSLQNQQSRGCHWLIKQGALLVESPQDVLEQLNLQQNLFSSEKNSEVVVDNLQKKIGTTKNNVQVTYPDLYQHIGHQAISADDLANLVDLPISEVLTQLLTLELEGTIFSVEGGYIRQ